MKPQATIPSNIDNQRVDENISATSNDRDLQQTITDSVHPNKSNLTNRDVHNLNTLDSILGLNNNLENFFLDLFFSDSKSLKVLDVLTGAGKTEALIDYLMMGKGDGDFKCLYAAGSIQELLEVVLRMRRKLIASGMQPQHANRYFTSVGRLSFNFDGSNAGDKKRIKELLESPVWYKDEKKFITSLKCSTNKFATISRVVITTHKHLSMKAELYSDYTVVIDELPTFAYDLVPTKLNAEKLIDTHLNIVDLSGEKFIDPDFMSLAVANDFIQITDFNEGSVLYHLNPHHTFKNLVVMTSYAESTGLGVLKRMGMDIEFIRTNESIKRLVDVVKKLTIDSLEHKSITNADSTKVAKELQAKAKSKSNSFTVSTAAQDLKDGLTIRTNKVGINSLGDRTEVLVATQLNMDDFERKQYKDKFGTQGLTDIERNFAGSKILQSIFRGCIRKGKEMRVLVCSVECKTRIVTSLKKYMENRDA